MKNNRGYSLIELIVVISIMAIMTSLISLSYQVVVSADNKKTAKTFVSYMKKAKIETMGRTNETLKLYTDADGAVFVKLSSASEAEKIGAGGQTVTWYDADGAGANSYVLNETGITFSFDRSSGAVSDLEGLGVACHKIIMTRGSSSVTIQIVPETGYISII